MKFMKTFTNLLVSIIMAAWIGAIAIFSIQNIEAVSLQFLTFRSLPLPVGVLLSFCLGTGLVVGAVAPLFLPRDKKVNRRRFVENDAEQLEEFDF